MNFKNEMKGSGPRILDSGAHGFTTASGACSTGADISGTSV